VANEYKKKQDGSVTVFGSGKDGRRIVGNIGAGKNAVPNAPTPRHVKADDSGKHREKRTLLQRIDDAYHRMRERKGSRLGVCENFGQPGHDIYDCAVCQFADVMNEINAETDVVERPEWRNSPFKWMLTLNPKAKGAIGEKAVEKWLTKYGFDVTKPETSEHDRIVNGHKIEVKMSMMWDNGTVRFSQIRDQDYEFAVLVGYEPHNVSMWIVPKALAVELTVPQHGGAAGEDTRWFGFNPGEAPEALKPYGGTPERALAAAKKYLGKPAKRAAQNAVDAASKAASKAVSTAGSAAASAASAAKSAASSLLG
jgi:hypothetical protein